MNRVGVRMKMLTWKWINVPRWLTKPNMIGGITIRRMERRRAGARLGAVWFPSRHFGVGAKFEVWTIGRLLFGMLYLYLLREGDQCWGVVWFLLIFSEKPKYAREMHGIIHSLNGGKLTFSLSVCNYHSSWIFTFQRQKKLPLSGFLIARRWLEEGLFLFGEALSSFDTYIPSRRILLAQLNEFLDI